MEVPDRIRKHETRCRETFGHAGGETDVGDQVAGGSQDEGEAGGAGSRTRWDVMYMCIPVFCCMVVEIARLPSNGI